MVGVIRMCQSIRWVRSHMPPWCASVIIQLISARYHGGYIGWVPTMAVAGYHAPVRSGWPIHRVSVAHRQGELSGVSNPHGSSCPFATGCVDQWRGCGMAHQEEPSVWFGGVKST